MGNFKVKVNSEAEAEEVKHLAVKAGYKMDDLFCQKWDDDFCYLLLCEDMSAGFGNEIMADGDKPLSIGELRDMVRPSLNDQYAEIEKVRQDNVNNPQHYNKGGVECIDAIEASMTPEAFKGYLKGNVQKYMWRYEQKGGVESLHKAQWYLERLVASMGS